MMSPSWYLRRLSKMGPAEIVHRLACSLRQRRWRRLLTTPVRAPDVVALRRFTAVLPATAVTSVPLAARARLLATADRLMDGHADYFGLTRADMVSPDWAFDPHTGRRAPEDSFSFDIAYRDHDTVGDIKQIWEPSRHQHLTVLAAAYAVTGDDRYACRVADHLKSWWSANPPLRGVHWTSGIELGIRLLSWVWVRRLLDGWADAAGLFEDNPEALRQIWYHQQWLASFPSRGSSANNHVIAEAAGQVAASSAFPWFRQSRAWGTQASRALDLHLGRNTFASGLNRELATEYHGLVLELGVLGAIEADLAGMAVPASTWRALTRMSDALAAVLDSRLRPPRQGDADDGHGLIVDGAGTNRWASLLATGDAMFGRQPWWPEVTDTDVRTPLLAALIEPRDADDRRPVRRPAHFADAGLTIMRARTSDQDSAEIWCRCDGGPHGFLSIAAHAHADALSVEVRRDGVDVLADPGTYCYHGEPRWRSYFRSTLGHNTVDLDGRDQSSSGGPFLWTRHARTRVLVAHATDVPVTGLARWCAEHDGYSRIGRPVVHRRTVELDGAGISVLDEIRSARRHRCRLAWHLGPAVTVDLDGAWAQLSWTDAGTAHTGTAHTAALELPPDLSWTAHRGETETPLGWYSPGFGRKQPAYTLLGRGWIDAATRMQTTLRFMT